MSDFPEQWEVRQLHLNLEGLTGDSRYRLNFDEWQIARWTKAVQNRAVVRKSTAAFTGILSWLKDMITGKDDANGEN